MLVTPSAIADLAVAALLEEAELTPKPALVDRRGSGAHADMDLAMMHRSALALRTTFVALADAAWLERPSQTLRERLAALGREAEQTMLVATGGINTHRGALWTLGLLVAGAASNAPERSPPRIAKTAGAMARYQDRFAPCVASHGAVVAARYGVRGARGEAQAGFPHVVELGWPELCAARRRGVSETNARLDALLIIMEHLDDTCLLYRGGRAALRMAQEGARGVRRAGGAASLAGQQALRSLEARLLQRNASPGGSADLLAATLFLDFWVASGSRPWRN